MRELITAKEKFYIIYDSDNNNKVVGMLNENMDKAVHDAGNPDNIKISSNVLESPEGEVLYLNEVQVNSEGIASRV